MTPLPPEMTEELDAIDATLAGEPVDPEYADLAELALLLRADRPSPADEFVTLLDERVVRRFHAAPPKRPRRARWLFAPAAGLAVALVVAVVVAFTSGGGSRPQVTAIATPAVGHAVAGKAAPARAAAASTAAQAAPLPSAPTVPPPTFPGRKQVQSSQLTLGAPPSRIEDVSRQVLVVVRKYNGYVNNSTITATGGPIGYAEFQLTVPSANLALALGDLSTISGSQVLSRTDNTNDVTDQFGSANSQLSQAQARRTSLLRQLQNATTQTQISAIQQQLSDVNRQISSAQATLRSLNHQISFSQISLTIQAGGPIPVHSSGGFTIHKAIHIAGSVVTFLIGVALIALAVAIPIGIVGALGWWIWTALRRRRREHALDLA